ncbi:MAG: L,D-transpeptidase [Myxococcales bacterium]|nr:L,D-transpeptidase [Myxococcota bacterium]MDW8280904.1 L,D-transpeptidase [Myxococcales bacterium]
MAREVPPPRPPRKFLIDGRLRPLKPGEVRPYVPPELEPEPEAEATEVKVVEVVEEDVQVLARPWYGAPMVGNLVLGARLPIRGTFQARSSRYCTGRKWWALLPFGWICARQARPTAGPPTDTPVLQVAPGERLPFRYVMVSSQEPIPMWANIEDFKEGRDPERMLEKGDSVAIDKLWKFDGESFYLSVEGRVLPTRGTYTLGQGSSWQGVLLDEKTHFPMGWVLPEHGKLLDAPGGKPVGVLPRRTRVDILEEVQQGGKRFLRVQPSDAAAANAAPAATAGPAALWMSAAEVNEVRRRQMPAGVNPVGRWIDVDVGEQTLVAYEGDRPIFATLISSGRAVPTPLGNYPVWAKVTSITMKSQPYDDKAYFVNKVPWVLFFQAHNAIHGAYWHDRFGVSKSHGCINVSPLDARYLFEWLPPALPHGWVAVRPVDLRESVTVHIYNSHLRRPFRQERPIGPPDREDEAERLEAAERRRAEQAAASAP